MEVLLKQLKLDILPLCGTWFDDCDIDTSFQNLIIRLIIVQEDLKEWMSYDFCQKCFCRDYSVEKMFEYTCSSFNYGEKKGIFISCYKASDSNIDQFQNKLVNLIYQVCSILIYYFQGAIITMTSSQTKHSRKIYTKTFLHGTHKNKRKFQNSNR